MFDLGVVHVYLVCSCIISVSFSTVIASTSSCEEVTVAEEYILLSDPRQILM